MNILVLIPAIAMCFVLIYWTRNDFFEFRRKTEKRIDDLERKDRYK